MVGVELFSFVFSVKLPFVILLSAPRCDQNVNKERFQEIGVGSQETL